MPRHCQPTPRMSVLSIGIFMRTAPRSRHVAGRRAVAPASPTFHSRRYRDRLRSVRIRRPNEGHRPTTPGRQQTGRPHRSCVERPDIIRPLAHTWPCPGAFPWDQPASPWVTIPAILMPMGRAVFTSRAAAIVLCLSAALLLASCSEASREIRASVSDALLGLRLGSGADRGTRADRGAGADRGADRGTRADRGAGRGADRGGGRVRRCGGVNGEHRYDLTVDLGTRGDRRDRGSADLGPDRHPSP